MRRLFIGLWLLGAVLCAAAAAAQRGTSYIRVADIKPGMKGYGLTVFRGTEPEKFDVEVIDVLKNFQPDQDLILIRTPNPLLNEAKVVAGMSGSPVYLDGKLAGAYAYGWSFAKEPVAGVTPIENMLEEMRRPVRPDAFPGAGPLPANAGRRGRGASASPPSAARLAGLPPYRGERRVRALDPIERFAALHRPAAGRPTLTRLETPVMLGGFTDSVTHMLADVLEPFGLVPLQAGGGRARRRAGRHGRGEQPSLPYVDGGAIGVQLMRGDISATAVGTVTHVAGSKLVAFGHPMLQGGELGLPTATARVLHVFQSQSRSFKIAEDLSPRGTMVQDRQAAIVVDQEMEPSVVPVTLRLHGVPGAPRAEWHVEVPDHRLLSPTLTFAALANAVQATASDMTDVVFTAKSRVDIEGYGPVEVVDKGYSFTGAAQAGVFGQLRVFDLMEVAYGNPFQPSRVRNVQVDMYLEFKRDVLEVVDASVPSTEVDPGSTVSVRITTRHYGEPDRVRVVPVHIPERAAGEKLEVEIAPGDEVDLEQPEPRSLSDMVHNVLQRYPSTSLVVSMKMPSRGLQFRGHVVRALPPSALDTLQLVNDSEHGQPFVTQERQAVDFGKVLSGTEKLEIQVRQRPKEGR